MLDMDHHPVKNYANIPATLSSEMEGSRMEAIRRQNANISSKDFLARMPRNRKVLSHNARGVKAADPIDVPMITISAINMRQMRFREHAGCLTWEPKAGSDELKEHLESILPQACLDNNSTENFRDLTKEEVAASKRGSKGKFPEKAGTWAQKKRKAATLDHERESQAPTLQLSLLVKRQRRSPSRSLQAPGQKMAKHLKHEYHIDHEVANQAINGLQKGKLPIDHWSPQHITRALGTEWIHPYGFGPLTNLNGSSDAAEPAIHSSPHEGESVGHQHECLRSHGISTSYYPSTTLTQTLRLPLVTLSTVFSPEDNRSSQDGRDRLDETRQPSPPCPLSIEHINSSAFLDDSLRAPWSGAAIGHHSQAQLVPSSSWADIGTPESWTETQFDQDWQAVSPSVFTSYPSCTSDVLWSPLHFLKSHTNSGQAMNHLGTEARNSLESDSNVQHQRPLLGDHPRRVSTADGESTKRYPAPPTWFSSSYVETVQASQNAGQVYSPCRSSLEAMNVVWSTSPYGYPSKGTASSFLSHTGYPADTVDPALIFSD